MTAGRAPLAVVILTFNEEANLPACLASVDGWAGSVFVVDSGSVDRTCAIASGAGAALVTHPFESHARQWQWALAALPIEAEWVLALDADQRVTPELRRAIDEALVAWQAPGSPAGAYVARRQVFRGRWIRHGGYYPKYLLKLFRRNAVSVDADDLVDHHFAVSGPTATLRGDLVEDNANERSIAAWIEKHNRYAARQAREEEERWAAGGGLDGARLFGTPDERTRWQKRIWHRLPLYLRPFGYFFYRYVLRLGVLDGKEGFIFHFMQAFWYRLLVDINRDEQRARAAAARGDTERASARAGGIVRKDVGDLQSRPIGHD
ncbi:MAG TPA: glycosyltransferase family 2 protein [Vicinamibacterales bacterium]|nr:glycosyltransferase family 2 protein [Vicinamibacterales bacterium]